MAIALVAVDQASPAIKGNLKRIFSLPLQGLQAEAAFKQHLILIKVWVDHHPGQERQQISGITAGAAQADQQSVLMGLTAQAGTATLHEIGQGEMVERSTATAHDRCQQLVCPALTEGIEAAAPWNPQLRRHHTGRAQRFEQQSRCRHQPLPPGRAIRVQAFSG